LNSCQVVHVVPNDDHRVGARDSGVDAFAQRARRNRPAIAESGGPINDDQPQILCQVGVLQPVIHYDNSGAIRGHGSGAFGAVSGNPAGRIAGQQQRFVPHFRRVMPDRIDLERPASRPAIAA
jgi:hypothetical protein